MRERSQSRSGRRSRLVALCIIALTASLSACEGGGSEESEGEEAYQTVRQGGQVDYSELSCGALNYLAGKYSSIADSGLRMNGDSPAATVAQMQAMQAANKASELYGMVAAGNCR